MKSSLIDKGKISDSHDRQNLSRIRQRFSAINEKRLARLRNALTSRQQKVLDSLPLLFHTNHPMMPGFTTRETPCRLANYKITKDILALGRTIARSFTIHHDLNQEPQIFGIYVMGSVGTIAQSDSSDLDIWLCFRPGLSLLALQQLNEKCTKISRWAMQMRMEMHFFLMDHEAFKRGQLSALNEESSGTAQRLLLLDEFYRTAIYLGGKVPLWWFVPAHCENDYAEYSDILLTRRFLERDQLLDFGGLPTLPDGEFLGAGFWQLYKAIESPYKSVLKLLLLESYADQYPSIQPLSLTFKALVYGGEMDIDQLDSYVMIYRRIEQYLLAGKQYRRLELARRCFYFKVNKPLTKPITGRDKSWQRRLLESLTADWGWSESQLQWLDSRRHWKTPEVIEERALLVNELNQGYLFLQKFADHTKAVRAISSEELIVLGRKQQAAFEQRLGKIDWINPGISGDLTESLLTLAESEGENKEPLWSVLIHPNGVLTERPTPVKTSPSLIELLMWCYCNQIITPSTRFELQQAPSVDGPDIQRILKSLSQWLPLPLANIDHNVFKRSAEPVDVLVLLNVGTSYNPYLDEQGVQRLSNQMDALRYSGFEENLVVSVDLVIRNSWNEITTRRFDKRTALLDGLQEYLKLSLPGSYQRPPNMQVECVSSAHASTIASRIRSWFSEIVNCYYSGQYPPATRYLFEMGGLYQMLQFKGPRLVARQYPTAEVLLDALGEAQESISPIYVDSRALNRHPLKVISQTINQHGGGRSWSGAIHIFFRRTRHGTAVFIVDEHGALSHRLYPSDAYNSPLKSLHLFLRSVINRQTALNQQLLYDFGIFPVHFHEIRLDSRQQLFAESKRVASELPTNMSLDVKAVGFCSQEKTLLFNFVCGEQEFTEAELGAQLYLVVAQFILSQRSSHDGYPVYITDLDLSQCQAIISEKDLLCTSHYLKIKNQLEIRLNRAIGILVKA